MGTIFSYSEHREYILNVLWGWGSVCNVNVMVYGTITYCLYGSETAFTDVGSVRGVCANSHCSEYVKHCVQTVINL